MHVIQSEKFNAPGKESLSGEEIQDEETHERSE
jgi:hypothetical protein